MPILLSRHGRVSVHMAFLLVMSSLAVACGQYKEKEDKNYRLYVATDDPAVRSQTERLVARYNQDAGFQALTLVDEESSDTSPVTFTNHLQDSTGKIGFGQWETATRQEPAYRSVELRPLNRTVSYRMNVEFDLNYFTSRMGSDEASVKGQELYILFCHEVGHGLTMEHDEAHHEAIMFPAVEARPDKDFRGYFTRVKDFFAK